MKNLFFFLISILLFGFTVSNTTNSLNSEKDFDVYYYYNFKDTQRGSLIIVYANSLEKAEVMFQNELYEYGLTYEPSNIVEIIDLDQIEDFVILSDSGDEY